MPARYFVSYPCNDGCATLNTTEEFEGAPVYRCPGCDSEWIETDEIPAPPVEVTSTEDVASVPPDEGNP